jgi:SPP1 gp7 family putative phage head morphogenesis protein
MMQPDLKYLIYLPPEKAIKFLKDKGYKFSWDWHEVWQDAHKKSFTVAKVMRSDILSDIREAVEKAMQEGQTLEQFKKGLAPTLKAKGWWGEITGKPEEVREELLKRKLVKDAGVIPDGDEIVTVKLGSPYRLKTIYRTNIQTSYMAGRYKTQAENTDNRPFWQYIAVMDRRTRPSHAMLNGRVFRFDDEFWNDFYPPNGWGCRCRVRALSEGNIKDRNLAVDSAEGQLSQEMKIVSKKTGELKPVAVYTDPLTWHKVSPDVGWSYNPGKQIGI